MQATIRAATPDDVTALAEAHVATWRETYRGLLPDHYLDGLTVAGCEPQWQRLLALPTAQRCVLIAEGSDGVIAGFASGGPHQGTLDYAGELYTLYLRQAYQGTGLGRALFAAIAARLREQGCPSLALWVLATNERARGFYAAQGGQLLREQAIVFDGIPLREAGYGWRDSDSIGRHRERAHER
ncbi:MAG TPA: GNAT family N-acetyltransferase [Thermomicrobiales bacterium]